MLNLYDLTRCFQGIVPSVIATSDRHGIPNVTYLSQVYLIDDRHVALSRQFFNKTQRNLDENPLACLEMVDPLTFQAYRLRLRFLRSEKSGPLFDVMSMRIEAIASHTGMTGIFKLIGSDVFEVRSVEKVEGFLSPGAESPGDAATLDGRRSEVRGLQWVSERINRAADLESLLTAVLAALEEFFHFSHTMVLLYDELTDRLTTMATHGYGESGVGAEVRLGEGLIGTVARERRLLRFKNLDSDLRYSRTIRRESPPDDACEEIPLPGLSDPQSMMAIPLTVGDSLVGVLVAEDRDPMRFSEWHEAYLEIIANQIALGIRRMIERAGDDADVTDATAAQPAPVGGASGAVGARRDKRTFVYYKVDDAIFVDGEYLIRNIPARILWKLLEESRRTGRRDFTNREVRLDQSLGLPPVKDNFESRLILLRHRLQEKSPDLRIVSTGRGRFSLQIDSAIEMIEK